MSDKITGRAPDKFWIDDLDPITGESTFPMHIYDSTPGRMNDFFNREYLSGSKPIFKTATQELVSTGGRRVGKSAYSEELLRAMVETVEEVSSVSAAKAALGIPEGDCDRDYTTVLGRKVAKAEKKEAPASATNPDWGSW